jgi:hypothetical protein
MSFDFRNTGNSFNYNQPHLEHPQHSHYDHELVNIDISHDTNIGLTGRKNVSTTPTDRWGLSKTYDVDEYKEFRGLSPLMRSIWHDKDGKKLFLFIVLLSSMSLIEILYGTWAGSLGTRLALSTSVRTTYSSNLTRIDFYCATQYL